MFFCVKVHIIIFKEKIGEIVIDASTSQLDDRLFLCPKASEGDLGIRSRRNEGKFLWRKDMTGEGFAVTTNGFDINANRPFGDDAGNGLAAMGKVEIEVRGMGYEV